MNRQSTLTPRRVVTGTLASLAALVALIATATGGSPATAAPVGPGSPGSPDSRVHVPAIRPAPGTGFITGIVVDQAGRHRDDVGVQAFAVGPRASSTPAASALTYAGPTVEHGYYRLQVPAGTYRLRFFSLHGTRHGFRPLAMPAHVAVRNQAVVREQPVAMHLVDRSPATLTVALSRSAAHAHHRGTATVTVSCRAVAAVLGTVKVYDGHRLLARGHLVHDRLRVRLPALHHGRHVLTAAYAGSPDVLPAHTHPVHVTVR